MCHCIDWNSKCLMTICHRGNLIGTDVGVTLTSVSLGTESCLERIVRYATYNHSEIFNLIMDACITDSQHTVHSYLHGPYTYTVWCVVSSFTGCMYWC